MSVSRGRTHLIVSLSAAGRPLNEIASAADISIRTLRRRLQDTQIAAAIEAARLDLEREAIGRLAALRRMPSRRSTGCSGVKTSASCSVLCNSFSIRDLLTERP